MGEIDNSELLDIMGGVKKPAKKVNTSSSLYAMDVFKVDNSMNGEQKCGSIIAVCVAAVAITVAICITQYNLVTFQQAIEAGMEEQYVSGSSIWVKPKTIEVQK
jgi:hypothetical protein